MVELVTANQGFYKRTRRGKVVQITREKVLRSADSCGFVHGEKLTVDGLRDIVHKGPLPHLLVLDTNAALQNIDVFESRMNVMTNVVVLQTVMQELQHLNQGVSRRLLALMKDKAKSYIFFPNEFYKETVCMRVNGESPNDANDRAVRAATKYFCGLVSDAGQVFMISNDVDNRRKAEKELQLTARSLVRYAEEHLKDVPEVLDLLAAEDGYNEARNLSHSDSPNLFEPYIPMEEVSTGLKTKQYLRGTIRARRDNCEDCYAVIHGMGKGGDERVSVSIRGRANVNRAVDGDVVALQLITDTDKKSTTSQSPGGRGTGGTASVADTTVLEATPEFMEGIEKGGERADLAPLEARVVGLVRRKWRHYAGSLASEEKDVLRDNGATSVLFLPVDKRVPPVRISTRRRAELTGKRILVGIDAWPATSEYPLGHFVRMLGNDGEKDVETAVLLHEFDVPHEAFTPEVMSCLPPSDWSIGPSDLEGRADFRNLPVVSIDPPGCKDIDDALHCIRLPNGRMQCGVHIADVTHFVHPGSPLDEEAQHRSTSTYLVERRLDMLPSLLTTELCSLRSKEDHLAFSVIWEMDDNCNVTDVQFTRSVIHSVASLTYDEAQAMLDEHAATGGRGMDAVGASVNMLAYIARTLRERRILSGALTLASPEVRFRLDADRENPTDVSVYALKEANALVEEFMLLANITVSKKILRHFPTLGILRRHQPPSKEQFLPLMTAAAAVGISLDISSSKTLADSLDAAVRENDPYFNKLLRVLATRCMMPAQYFCSGEVPPDQWWHYGLAAPVYSHFTSPIRRYADVCVHRLLAAAIGDKPLPPAYADRSKQQDLCSHMNRRHKAAQHASRASTNLHTVLYFRGRPTDEDAYVVNVASDRVVLLVPKFGLEGTVILDDLAKHLGAELTFDAVRQVLSASDTVSLTVLQKVRVRISVAADGERGQKLRLGLLIEGREFGCDEEGGLEDRDERTQSETAGVSAKMSVKDYTKEAASSATGGPKRAKKAHKITGKRKAASR